MNSEQKKRMVFRCAVCGEAAPAYAQWHNRDNGFGCCPSCYVRVSSRYGEAEAKFVYGLPGTHHSIEDEVEHDT